VVAVDGGDDMAVLVVFLAKVEDVVPVVCYRYGRDYVPADTFRVVGNAEAGEVGWVMAVHGAYLSEAAEDLRLLMELHEWDAGFGVWWLDCDYPESSSQGVGLELALPVLRMSCERFSA
jgi:hypothetical protein